MKIWHDVTNEKPPIKVATIVETAEGEVVVGSFDEYPTDYACPPTMAVLFNKHIRLTQLRRWMTIKELLSLT